MISTPSTERFLFPALLAAALTAACGTLTTEAPRDDAGSAAPSPAAAGTGASADEALRILRVSTTAATLTGGSPSEAESGSLVVAAVVTHRGDGTLAGGTLEDERGRVYAAFSAGAEKGTFTAPLTWRDANVTAPITFTGTGARATLVARFFDDAGREAKATVEIGLACRDRLYGLVAACAGECADLASTGAHCGACGRACGAGLVCDGGTCEAATLVTPKAGGAALTGCIDTRTVVRPLSCEDVCKAAGKACTNADDTGGGFPRAGTQFMNAGCAGSLAGVSSCTSDLLPASFTCACK